MLQPIENLYITVDAYRIDIDDRIVLSENLTSNAARNYLQANGFPGIGGGRYFTNAVDTKTQGVDAVGTYRWNLDGGSAELTSGYNYNKTEVERVADNPAALEAIDPGAVRIGRAELGRITEGTPRDKFFLGGTGRRATGRSPAPPPAGASSAPSAPTPAATRPMRPSGRWTWLRPTS